MKRNVNTRIAVAGIGGIGGYIGGKLAHYYANIKNVEIVFIARGEMADEINKNGLCLVSKGDYYTCKPGLVSDNPLEIGIVDVFIICTKNFSVAGIFKRYATCITNNTVVITTQNTVNGKETITPFLPVEATLMEGCIYIASNFTGPGKVEHISGPAKFIFGTNGENSDDGEGIAAFFQNAGIDATFTTSIASALWKKFMFVSPAAIVTAVFGMTFSEIAENVHSKQLFTSLIAELMQLATAKQISIDADTVLNNINLLNNFKGAVKSSFQLDLEKLKPSEIDSLVNFVIGEGKEFHIPTPYYERALVLLTEKYTI